MLAHPAAVVLWAKWREMRQPAAARRAPGRVIASCYFLMVKVAHGARRNKAIAKLKAQPGSAARFTGGQAERTSLGGRSSPEGICPLNSRLPASGTGAPDRLKGCSASIAGGAVAPAVQAPWLLQSWP